jgi:hypothetical protein
MTESKLSVMARMVSVLGCPCGTMHSMDAKTKRDYDAVTADVDPLITVTTGAGSWRVPRIFIACHGVKADEMADVAERYGFERAH